MAHRKEINNKNLDAKIFRRAASNTKTINVDPRAMRGGTRL